MNPISCDDALARLVDIDALDPSTRAAVECHVEDCPHCREELDFMHQLAETFHALPASPPPELADRVMTGIVRERRLPQPRGLMVVLVVVTAMLALLVALVRYHAVGRLRDVWRAGSAAMDGAVMPLVQQCLASLAGSFSMFLGSLEGSAMDMVAQWRLGPLLAVLTVFMAFCFVIAYHWERRHA